MSEIFPESFKYDPVCSIPFLFHSWQKKEIWLLSWGQEFSNAKCHIYIMTRGSCLVIPGPHYSKETNLKILKFSTNEGVSCKANRKTFKSGGWQDYNGFFIVI